MEGLECGSPSACNGGSAHVLSGLRVGHAPLMSPLVPSPTYSYVRQGARRKLVKEAWDIPHSILVDVSKPTINNMLVSCLQ